MNCRECHDKLSLYIDGQLTDEERLRVEEALKRCPECVEELAALSLLTEEMGHFGDVPIPTDLLQDLKSAFRQELAETSKSRKGPSFLKRMGNWRVAASVAALLFATWAIVEDRASRVTPEGNAGQEVGALFDRASEQGEWSAGTLDGAEAPEDESIDENEDRMNPPNPATTLAPARAKRVAPMANKKSKVFKLKIDAKSPKEELEDEDSEEVVLAVSPTRDQYLRLVPEMKSRIGNDFQAEPWPEPGRGFADAADGASQARKMIGTSSKNKVGRSPKVLSPVAKAKGKNKSLKRKRPGPVPVISSAFFALGPKAGETIKAAAEQAGLTIVPSELGTLAKDKAKSIEGEILTVELTKSQKDALLRTLEKSKNLRIQLFGRGGERLLRQVPEEKTKVADRDSLGREEIKKGVKGQSDLKAPAADTKSNPTLPSGTRFRLSFILLRR